MFLLDANAVSHFIRFPDGVIARRLAAVGDTECATSIVVAAELRFGAELKGSPRLTERVDGALLRLAVLPLDVDADRHYGRIRADLRRRGQPIGANDMLVAAHALALGATLVTDNIREFERVGGLLLENWLRED